MSNPTEDNLEQQLTDIFAEMARSYDEVNIWTQRKKVLALIKAQQTALIERAITEASDIDQKSQCMDCNDTSKIVAKLNQIKEEL